MVRRRRAIVAVSDVPRAVEHHKRLGFEISYHDEGYAFAHRNDLTIHLAGTDDARIARAGPVYLHLDDADKLADEYATPVWSSSSPRTSITASARGSNLDPDGNLIRFGSPLRR